MGASRGVVLIVDDERFNLEILTEYLQEIDYESVAALNGESAWEYLCANPERFDAVLLDRMMPGMDGLELLTRIKRNPRLASLPVVMQTGCSSQEEVLEGLRAGAYYYLIKPFERDPMLAILETAVADHQRYRMLREQLAGTARTLALLRQGQFVFRTLEEARDLATLLANASTSGQRIVVGLSELFINAVEHGNLGIGYAEKTNLNTNGTWALEIERRMALPAYADKTVTVEFCNTGKQQQFIIRDQGNGFDWNAFLALGPERAFDNHGRGIAVAKALSFDHLEYRGKGNEVLAVVGQ